MQYTILGSVVKGIYRLAKDVYVFTHHMFL